MLFGRKHPSRKVSKMKDIQLYSCLLTAPSPEQMSRASEHLRYWPYIKAFRKFGSHSMEIVVNIGNSPSLPTSHRLLSRSRELIHLCLRQYGIRISDSWQAEPDFRPSFSPDLFLRPDESLQPFREFIEDLDSRSKSISHSKL